MATVGRASVTITADLSKFANNLDKQLNKILNGLKFDSRGLGNQIKRGFDEGVAGAKRSMSDLNDTAKREFSDTSDTINKELGDIDDRGAFDRLRRRSDDASRSISSRFVSALSAGARAFGGFASAALKTVSTFGALTAGLATVLGGVAALSAGFTALSAATASVLNTFPAFITGLGTLGALFATVKVATLGMGDAFEAAASGDAAKLQEAMEKLSPAAQEVVQAFADFQPKLQQIRESVQEGFFEGMADDLQLLADRLAGPVQEGMTETATALGHLVSNLLEVGRQGPTVKFLENSFKLATTAVQQLAEPLKNVLEGLVAVGNAGLPAFSGFITGLASATDAFGDFLKRVAEVGFTDALGELFDPGAIASKIGEFFTGILQTIAEQIPVLATAIIEGREAFFNAVLQVFSALVEVLPTIVPQVLEALFALITTVASTLAEAAPLIVESAISFISGLVEGIQSALPGVIESAATIIQTLLGALVEALPLLIEGAASLVTGIADGLASNASMILNGIEAVIESVLTALVDALPSLVESGTELLVSIAEGLAEALPKLATFITTDLIPSLLDAFLEAAPKMLQAGADVITALAEGLADSLPELAETISSEVIPNAVTAFTEALPDIIEAGINLMNALIQGVTTAIPLIIEAFLKIWPQILAAVIQALPLLLEAGIQILVALIDGLAEALPDIIIFLTEDLIPLLIDTIITLLPEIIDAGIKILLALIDGLLQTQGALTNAFITKIIPALLRAAITAVPLLLAAGIKMIVGLINGITQKARQLFSYFAGIGKKIVNAIPNLGDLLKGVAGDIIGGFVDSIRGAFNDVKSAFSDLTSLIPDWKGPEQVDKHLLDKPAELIMSGFANALETQAMRSVMPALAGIGTDITANVTSDVGAFTPSTSGLLPSESTTQNDTFVGTAVIDLGEGIQKVVEMKFSRQNRSLTRRVLAGSGQAT